MACQRRPRLGFRSPLELRLVADDPPTQRGSEAGGGSGAAPRAAPPGADRGHERRRAALTSAMSSVHVFANLVTWASVPGPERRTVLEGVAAALGAPWRAGPSRVGRHGLGALTHGDLGLDFVIVPGGWLRMGLSADDLFAIAAARGDATRVPWSYDVDRARPTRWVAIRPFLLAVSGLPPGQDDDVAGDGGAGVAYRDAAAAIRGDPPGDHGDDAGDPPMRVVAAADALDHVPAGFRLPSEAELEWAFREAGTTRWIGVPGDRRLTAASRWGWLGKLDSGFGLRGFVNQQNLTADVWSDDQPERTARSAHTCWQDDDAEVLGLHPANRFVPDDCGESIVRLAADLPGASEVEPGEPGELADDGALLTALGGDDARARGDAVVALRLLAGRPGPDVAATARAVVGMVTTVAPPLAADLLAWLGDVAMVANPAPILPLLDADDPAVRGGAVHAVATCAAARDALAGRLRVEDVPGVRAGLLVALAGLGAEVAALGVDPVSRAAIAVGAAGRGAIDVDALIAALDLDPIEHLAHARGALGAAALGHLRDLGPAERQRAAVALARRAARGRDLGLARTAVAMAFGPRRDGAPSPLDPAAATAAQRAVVAAIVPLALDELASRGVPMGYLGALRWAGVAPPGACERPLDHDGRRRPLWCALLAAAEPAAVLATLDPATRLAVFLERGQYGLGRVVPRDWTLDALLAAADPEAARAVVDALLPTYLDHQVSGGAPLLHAVVATRSPGEAPPVEVMNLVGEWSLVHAADALRAFPRPAVESRLLDVLRPLVDEAIAGDGWTLGAHTRAAALARLLAICPSPHAARAMLLLGWAGGHPASVRAAVGEHAGDDPGLRAVLADYDALPIAVKAWPSARAALLGSPGWAELARR
jgi:hypothetical protein